MNLAQQQQQQQQLRLFALQMARHISDHKPGLSPLKCLSPQEGYFQNQLYAQRIVDW